ncbi:MAG: YggT family protein [Clostridia bacterium]|nr:YggT family protein [Clostridia bacterium]
MYVLYMAARLVTLLLWVLEIAMLLRAIASWIPALDGMKWMDIVYMLTEPLVVPVRAIFERFALFRNSPIDFSFVIAFLLLGMVQTVMSHFTALLLL